MSKLKDLITNITVQSFKYQEREDENNPLAGLIDHRKQISLRPNLITLTKIDVLADWMDVSRQSLVDDLLDLGIDDAIDAYCDAHGPKHRQEVMDQFIAEFHQRAVGHDGKGKS